MKTHEEANNRIYRCKYCGPRSSFSTMASMQTHLYNYHLRRVKQEKKYGVFVYDVLIHLNHLTESIKKQPFTKCTIKFNDKVDRIKDMDEDMDENWDEDMDENMDEDSKDTDNEVEIVDVKIMDASVGMGMGMGMDTKNVIDLVDSDDE